MTVCVCVIEKYSCVGTHVSRCARADASGIGGVSTGTRRMDPVFDASGRTGPRDWADVYHRFQEFLWSRPPATLAAGAGVPSGGGGGAHRCSARECQIFSYGDFYVCAATANVHYCADVYACERRIAVRDEGILVCPISGVSKATNKHDHFGYIMGYADAGGGTSGRKRSAQSVRGRDSKQALYKRARYCGKLAGVTQVVPRRARDAIFSGQSATLPDADGEADGDYGDADDADDNGPAGGDYGDGADDDGDDAERGARAPAAEDDADDDGGAAASVAMADEDDGDDADGGGGGGGEAYGAYDDDEDFNDAVDDADDAPSTLRPLPLSSRQQQQQQQPGSSPSSMRPDRIAREQQADLERESDIVWLCNTFVRKDDGQTIERRQASREIRWRKVVNEHVADCVRAGQPVYLSLLISFMTKQAADLDRWRTAYNLVPAACLPVLRAWTAERVRFLWTRFRSRARARNASPLKYSYAYHTLAVLYCSATGIVWANSAEWLLSPIPYLSVLLPSQKDLSNYTVSRHPNAARIEKGVFTRTSKMTRNWLVSLTPRGQCATAELDAGFAARMAEWPPCTYRPID